MNKIIDDLKQNVKSILHYSRDLELEKSNFEIEILKELNLKFPQFDELNVDKENIKSKTVNPGDYTYQLPPGNYDSYYVKIPIINNSYFDEIFKTITDHSFKSEKGKFLIYEDLSIQPLFGNDKNIESAKSKFLKEYTLLKQDFTAKNLYFDNYVNTDLVEFIRIEIQEEIKRRKEKTRSLELAKPF